jgi:hypothetical protein
MANKDLRKAREAENDEFYTQIVDIENECSCYQQHFKGKTIFCNCDDPFTSNFFKHFAMIFNSIGLKRLITTSYDPSPIAGTQLPFDEIAGMKNSGRKAYIFDTTAMPDINKDGAVDLDDTRLLMETVKEVVRPLQGNGDFRSKECIELLKQADIVVTNPPFSLFREYVAQLIEYDKKFLIIGNQNNISYKEIFNLIKENKMWLGMDNGGTKWFQVPPYYDIQTDSRKKIGKDGKKYFSMGNIAWFTNLDHHKRHQELILFRNYNETDFPKYDNYDAINVSRYTDIPCDYDGVMGVPVTFLDKYNPAQFEIIGIDRYVEDNPHYGHRFKLNGKETYARILIKRK